MSPLSLVLLLPVLAVSAALGRDRRQTFERGHSIAVGSATNKCLTVTSLFDGNVVTATDCDVNKRIFESGAPVPLQPNTWEISPGSGAVRLSNSNFCLDAGENPHNNAQLKIWTCYEGLPQQTWYLTDDARIAITGGDQCLDQGVDGPQTYQCTPGNDNQVWSIQTPVPYGVGVSSSVAAGPTPTATVILSSSRMPAVSTISIFSTMVGPIPSATPTFSGGLYPPNAPGGTQIHPNGDRNLCLTIGNGYVAQGTAVNINSCFTPASDGSASYSNNQLWDIAAGEGKVRLHNSIYCLDFGSSPADGTSAKIWDCLDVPQQRFYYTADNRIALSGGDQCLDVVAASGPTQTKPYGSLKDVQSWQCTDGNVHQIWTTN